MNEPTKRLEKPTALPVDKLRWRCEPARLPFETTAQAELREGFVGQERALRALKMGVELTAPGYNVFTRRDGSIRHFWAGEMGPSTADPGQDPRGAPDFDPLWTILDTTPEGRGKDWYPCLSY